MFAKKKKVPLIMQMEMLECGAACLAMILAYHGKWIPLEKVRQDCGVSRDGSNALNMIKAARNYGFKAGGKRGEPTDLKNVLLPCIIHWNFNHFVVLTGLTNKYAYINDPGGGAVKVPIEEFDRAFTGVYLTFEKTENFKPEGQPKSVFLFAKKRLKGTLVPFIFVITTGVITAVLGIINPLLSRVFLDRVLTGINVNWLYPLIAFMAIVATLFIIVAGLLFQFAIFLLYSVIPTSLKAVLSFPARRNVTLHHPPINSSPG